MLFSLFSNVQTRILTFCFSAVGLMVVSNPANAQCNCDGSAAVVVAQTVNYDGTFYAPSSTRYDSGSGIAYFSHYNTPQGSARRIPGQTFPVQTMVANTAPVSSLGSSGQTRTYSTYRRPRLRGSFRNRR